MVCAMRTTIDSYKARTGRVDLSDIDFGDFEVHPLPAEALRALRYLHDIEHHTVCYLRDLLLTPAHQDPVITHSSRVGSTRRRGTGRPSPRCSRPMSRRPGHPAHWGCLGLGDDGAQGVIRPLELCDRHPLVAMVGQQRVSWSEVGRRHTVLPEGRHVGPADLGRGAAPAALHQRGQERLVERRGRPVAGVEHLEGVPGRRARGTVEQLAEERLGLGRCAVRARSGG